MDVYFFGESLVASVVFNFTDWLRGNGGFVENLVDFGIDVGPGIHLAGNRRVELLHAAVAAVPLLPPRPPMQLSHPWPSTTLMGPTPQSVVGDIILTPVGDITDALVNANETFFDVDGSCDGIRPV